MSEWIDIACTRVEAGLADRGYTCWRMPVEVPLCEIVATKGDDVRHVIVVPWTDGIAADPQVSIAIMARATHLTGHRVHIVKVMFVNGRPGVNIWEPSIE